MISFVTRRLSAIAGGTILLGLSLIGGSSAAAKGPSFPPGWTEISINVVIRHVPHTLVYDRGRIIAVSGSSLTLKERDGNVVPINVSPTAQIMIDGQPAALSQVRVLETATTLRVDGGAAEKVTVQIPPKLAAAIARRQGGA